MAIRYDFGSLKSPRKGKNGWLRVDGYLTRTGVFTYRNADGSERRELRLESEVFHADALASFASVPVTNDHPPEILDAGNTKKYAVGAVGAEPRRDGDRVRASMLITDADAVKSLEAGKRELSCGYECDLEETAGEHAVFGRYDAVQRNIRGNHVAIVDAGRAGAECAARMDALGSAGGSAMLRSDPQDKGARTMDEKDLVEKLVAANKRADAAEAALAAEKSKTAEQAKRADTAEAQRDEAKASQAKAEKSRTDAAEGERARIDARVALERAAVGMLGEMSFAGKSDRQVRLDVLAKISPEYKPADKDSDDYVLARYDAAVAAQEPAIAKAREAATGDVQKQDAAPQDEKTRRDAMVARGQARWQKKPEARQ